MSRKVQHGLQMSVVAWALLWTAAAVAQTDVQALADRWVQAYNKYDRAALGALYTPDASLMMHGEPSIAGRKAIEDFWAEDFKDRDPLTLLKVTHSVNGVDMMLVHGNYEVINRQDGSHLGGGRFAHIWTRQGSSWQLDRDLWNAAFEPYAPDPQVKDDIQALAEKWTRVYNKHDKAALQALYTDKARLMLHGGPTVNGQAGIGTFWASDFKVGNPVTLLRVTNALQGADMMLVHGNYEVVDRVGGVQVSNGRFAHIWVSDGKGGWRLDRDLWFQKQP